MNTMTYKGYLGSVAYSDQVFFGKIEGINGLVNFEGESVKELTEAFHEAVDNYQAYCKQAGQTLNAFIKEAVEEKVEAAVAV